MVLPQHTLLAVLAVLASTPGGLATALPRIPVQQDLNGDPAGIAKSWDPQGAHGLANPEVAEGIRTAHERTACATIIHGVCQPSAEKPVPKLEAEEPTISTLPKPKRVSGGGHAKCGAAAAAARKKESPILKSRDLNYLPPRPPPDWYDERTRLDKRPLPQSTPEPEAKQTAQSPAEGVPADDDCREDAPTDAVVNQIPYQHREFAQHPEPPASYLFVENLGIGLDPRKEVVPPVNSPAGHLLNSGLKFWNLYLEAPRSEYLACFQVDYDTPKNADRLLCRKATKDLTVLRDHKDRPWAFLYRNHEGRNLLTPCSWRGDCEPAEGQTARVKLIPIRVAPWGRRIRFGDSPLLVSDGLELPELKTPREHWGTRKPKAKEPVAIPKPEEVETPLESPEPEPKKVEAPVGISKTEKPEESI